jgi:hypothetical protein
MSPRPPKLRGVWRHGELISAEYITLYYERANVAKAAPSSCLGRKFHGRSTASQGPGLGQRVASRNRVPVAEVPSRSRIRTTPWMPLDSGAPRVERQHAKIPVSSKRLMGSPTGRSTGSRLEPGKGAASLLGGQPTSPSAAQHLGLSVSRGSPTESLVQANVV